MDIYSINLANFMGLGYNEDMLQRIYESLEQHLKPNKVLLIYGPRRVGKTTLLQQMLSQTRLRYKLDSGDNLITQQLLSSQDFKQILSYVESYDLIAIDEAQNIPNIGMGLKIIVDQMPGIKVIATGSSSLELAGQVGEPLTGRKQTLVLYPISQAELKRSYNRFELTQNLPDYLIFGTYPEVLLASSRAERISIITEIVSSYLLKDILAFGRVKSSRTLLNLLKMLAFQLGNEVSINELAAQLRVDTHTIQRYLDLLEKSFVVFRLNGFSRNLRKEVTSKSKYYFWDTGIRNAIVAQFNPLDQRNDVEPLWENFIMIERIKHRTYSGLSANAYFWRTYDQKEIDLVEEREGRLHGYEVKWTRSKSLAPTKLWLETYPNAEYSVINPDNYLDFITPQEN
ncbi:MAG: ATP-binding protein [Anaerolineaceae bacterium]